MSTGEMEGEEGNQPEQRGDKGLDDSRGGERTAGLCWERAGVLIQPLLTC